MSNVICSVIYGRRFEYTDERFQRLLAILNQMFEHIGAGGAVQFVPIFSKMQFLPIVRKMIHINIRFEEMLHQLLYTISAHEEEENENPRYFVGAFLKEMNDKKKQGNNTFLNSTSLYYTTADLFGAGTETTTTTLYWALLYMIAFPEIQSRVQQEIDDAVGRNRLPRLSDKPELPYTEAALHEIQRIGSIVPLGVPHKCMEDTTFRG